jgi:hypothetical protein
MPEKQTAKREDFMKKTIKRSANGTSDEILPHYDFSNGVRGKHYKKFRKGITVRLIGEHIGSTVIVLDEDLGNIFPDSKSVNDALHHLVQAVPKVRRKKAA